MFDSSWRGGVSAVSVWVRMSAEKCGVLPTLQLYHNATVGRSVADKNATSDVSGPDRAAIHNTLSALLVRFSSDEKILSIV